MTRAAYRACWLGLCLVLTGCASRDVTEPLHVAVASNFTAPMETLVAAWTDSTGGTARVSSGSTGRLIAQIRNGAPYDVFFSADADGPEWIEQMPASSADMRVTYAVGRIVLWDPSGAREVAGGEVLQDDSVGYVAIANPELAPYGRAARDALGAMGHWERLKDRLVRGESIAQAYQFGRTGNADLALVARAQMQSEDHFWVIPDSLHAPITQQAIRLTRHPDAAGFLAFVRSGTGRRIIRSYGYETP